MSDERRRQKQGEQSRKDKCRDFPHLFCIQNSAFYKIPFFPLTAFLNVLFKADKLETFNIIFKPICFDLFSLFFNMTGSSDYGNLITTRISTYLMSVQHLKSKVKQKTIQRICCCTKWQLPLSLFTII